ncbi:MAG: MetS family NSS transporter small subunit [Acidobacteriota bacterium]|nr:MetS family NSS transporter small subunit [Acidobacteriota bacterium]MDH3523641.1 MetS family NSS transporter small subunit [Acidobacteriota bacterium]
MTGTAIAMMGVVCGFVWGGFCYLLARAIRSEAGKS